MTYLLALASSLLWGTSDFLGGRLSRRLPALWVVGVSQLCSFVLLTVAAIGAFAFGIRAHGSGWLLWGLGGGVALTVALASFYKALAAGRMGVVAPIASTGVVVPVLVGLADGNRPTVVQAMGIAVAVVGVVLASRPAPETVGTQVPGTRAPAALALLAGLGFGTALVCLQRGAVSDGLDALWAMRLAILVLLAVPAWRLQGLARTAMAGHGADTWRTLALLGACDVAANGAFTLASRGGALALVAVLSSLYPVVATLLARQVLGERLSRGQVAGVLVTMAGSLLIVV